MRGTHTGLNSAALSGAFFALAGHVALLAAYGTVLPYRDQWQCTAFDLLGPWARGNLSVSAFWTPLNDHWPVLTRVLSFGLVKLNGQWNNLVETSVNALIFAAAVFVFLRALLPGIPRYGRVALVLLAGAVLALPITWENTLWGIQSLVYLQIVLTLIYLSAVATERSFTGKWWIGHVAGLAVIFTQHSAVIAHIAAGAMLTWRLGRRDGEPAVIRAGLIFCAAIIGLFVVFFPSISTTANLRADSWQLALEVGLRQLAWPLPDPAWAFLVYLPWSGWMFNRLRARFITPVDAFILMVGLWAGGQAAAIGYGRAVETYTFASRYCDFLALGWLVNAACFGRMWFYFPRRLARVAMVSIGLIWLILPVKSFWQESRGSHAGHNLARRPGENERNLTRLRTWFQLRDDARLINDPGVQQELFTYAPSLPPLLRLEKFQRLLPPETGSPGARPDHGRLSWLPTLLLRFPLAWFAGAMLLAILSFYRGRGAGPMEALSPSQLSSSFSLLTLGFVFLVSLIGWRSWRNPDVYETFQRYRDVFAPVDRNARFADLEFDRDTGDFQQPIRTQGAVASLPDITRPFWYGTKFPGTTEFRGTLRSKDIIVSHRFLVIPFTGYPCTAGNGLRVRYTDPATKKETWESYVGSDPGSEWNLWIVDAEKHRGESVSIFLFDGLDGPAGWLGVARPGLSDDKDFPSQWRALFRAERSEPTHRALVILTVVSGFSVLGFGWFSIQRRSLT